MQAKEKEKKKQEKKQVFSKQWNSGGVKTERAKG